jgi:hypothetical protein
VGNDGVFLWLWGVRNIIIVGVLYKVGIKRFRVHPVVLATMFDKIEITVYTIVSKPL